MESKKLPRNVINYFKENPDETVCFRCDNCRRIMSKTFNERFRECAVCDYPSRSRKAFHRQDAREFAQTLELIASKILEAHND